MRDGSDNDVRATLEDGPVNDDGPLCLSRGVPDNDVAGSAVPAHMRHSVHLAAFFAFRPGAFLGKFLGFVAFADRIEIERIVDL